MSEFSFLCFRDTLATYTQQRRQPRQASNHVLSYINAATGDTNLSKAHIPGTKSSARPYGQAKGPQCHVYSRPMGNGLGLEMVRRRAQPIGRHHHWHWKSFLSRCRSQGMEQFHV